MPDIPKLQPLEGDLCLKPIDVPVGLREQYAGLLREQQKQWQRIPADKQGSLAEPNNPSTDPVWVTWDTTVQKRDGSPLKLHVLAEPGKDSVIREVEDKTTGQRDSYGRDGERTEVYFNALDPQGNPTRQVLASFDRVNDTGTSFIRKEEIMATTEPMSPNAARGVTFSFDKTGKTTKSECY